MKNLTIEIELRNVYGNVNMYVVSEHKDFVNGLTGRKTIHNGDIENLKALGFTVVEAAKAQRVL